MADHDEDPGTFPLTPQGIHPDALPPEGWLDEGSRRFLGFGVAKRRFLIPLEAALAVLPSASTTPLPRTPEWVLGVFGYRGQVIPLIDLGRLPDPNPEEAEPPAQAGKPTRNSVLVTEFQGAWRAFTMRGEHEIFLEEDLEELSELPLSAGWGGCLGAFWKAGTRTHRMLELERVPEIWRRG